jgi:CheY-like chemotaxis protein
VIHLHLLPAEPGRKKVAAMPMRILFVDDVRDTRDLFRLWFGMQGHQTHLASDGIEAVEAVKEENFDAVVMDVEMPRMNGWDAVREIRSMDRGRELPIILFTAYSAQEDHQRASQAGADTLLRKPMLPQEVLSHISELRKQRGMEA